MPSLFWWASALAIAAALLVRRWLDQRRGRALDAVAHQLGLARDAECDAGELGDLPLFRLSEAGRLRDAFRGRLGSREVIVADYRYRVGNRRTETTAIAVSIRPGTVPACELRQENASELFGQHLRAYLQRLPSDLCLESDGRWLLMYPCTRTVPKERLGLYCRRLQWIAASLERGAASGDVFQKGVLGTALGA